MIKYIKSKIGIKIFLLNIVILMAVSGITYGFVAAFMPLSYSDSLERTLDAKAKKLAESLSGYTLEKGAFLIKEFSNANQSKVVLYNGNGGRVWEWNGLGDEGVVTTVIQEGDSETVTAEAATEGNETRELEQRRMEFFADASHELKTPVTILKGQIEGMEQNVGVYKDRDKYLARAREVTVTLQNMVQEILMISRMESCGFSLKKKEMDLAELVRLQLADLNELFEQKNMELEISLPEKCFCMADPGLMEIVVRNILVNAARYSPAGERISVKLFTNYNEASSTSNSSLEEISDCQNLRESKSMNDTLKIFLKVENTGVHINEQDLPRLFDAFYRVDSSRNRKNGGSGLGLYIVREILEQHEAEYEMRNTEAGVCFQMKI